MHPETLLQVARIEHQQRVAEATRSWQAVRALTGRVMARRPARAGAAPVLTTGDAAHCAQCVPRLAT